MRRRRAAQRPPDPLEILQYRRDARRAVAAVQGDEPWSRERVAFELSAWVDEHPLPNGLTFDELVDAYLRARMPR